MQRSSSRAAVDGRMPAQRSGTNGSGPSAEDCRVAGRLDMGLFEEQPLLLVPLIVIVVVAYDALKYGVRQLLAARRNRWRSG